MLFLPRNDVELHAYSTCVWCKWQIKPTSNSGGQTEKLRDVRAIIVSMVKRQSESFVCMLTLARGFQVKHMNFWKIVNLNIYQRIYLHCNGK